MQDPFKNILNYNFESLHQFIAEVPKSEWGTSESGRTPIQLAYHKGSALLGIVLLAAAPESIDEVNWTHETILQEAIEEYSEQSLCSGWNTDIECELWAIINQEYTFHEDDRLDWLTEETKASILKIANLAKIWPTWRSEMEDVELVPLERWIPIYNGWKQSRS